jgi:hypothetical protein
MADKIVGKKVIIFVVIVCFCCTSCSRKSYHGVIVNKTEGRTENRDLKKFMDGGMEKKLRTGDVTPSRIIKTARKYIGVPHCMGGITSKCMDCSGLLLRVFASYGINLPHNAEEQARYGKILNSREQLREGDLVFFVNTYKTNRYITHSGIYLGNGRFIHTSSSRGVTETALDNPWWRDKFIFGTRVF